MNDKILSTDEAKDLEAAAEAQKQGEFAAMINALTIIADTFYSEEVRNSYITLSWEYKGAKIVIGYRVNTKRFTVSSTDKTKEHTAVLKNLARELNKLYDNLLASKG